MGAAHILFALGSTPHSETPPPPPPYHAYHDEDANTPEARFRRAVSEGDIQGATALLAEDGGHKLIETAHYNGNTPLFEVQPYLNH